MTNVTKLIGDIELDAEQHLFLLLWDLSNEDVDDVGLQGWNAYYKTQDRCEKLCQELAGCLDSSLT
jgi:hypothetical protein